MKPPTTSDDDQILYSVHGKGRRRRGTSGRQRVRPKFVPIGRIKGSHLIVGCSGCENEAAAGHNQTPEVSLSPNWCSVPSQFCVSPEGNLPHLPARIEIQCRDIPPRGLYAGVPLVIKKELPDRLHQEGLFPVACWAQNEK